MMEVIKKLSLRIPEEVSDSWFYSELASELKDEHPDIARTLNTIAEQETEHMNMLHRIVVDLIQNHK